MATSLGVAGRTSSLLEPSNEGLEGEGLGELSAGGRSSRGSGGRAGNRCGLSSDGCSSGSRGNSRGSSSGGSSRGSGGSGGSAVTSASGGSGGGGAGAGATGPERRAGDVVVDGGGVRVEDDAVLVGGVETGADNTLGGLGTGTSNLVTLVYCGKAGGFVILPRCSSTEGSSGHRWRSQHRGER